jgi:hypothetical protein
MRIRKEYRVREMAGERIVVVPGAAHPRAEGLPSDGAGTDAAAREEAPRGRIRLVALNDSSYYLWERLSGRDFSVEDAARLLTERYDVTPQRARLDAEAWIRRLETCGIVER